MSSSAPDPFPPGPQPPQECVWTGELADDLATFDDLVSQRAARRFRDVLGHYASGVTIVTAVSDGEPVGMTCQSFSSVSLDPPLVLFVPARTSRAYPRIRRAGVFCVNLLSDGQQALSNQFAGRIPEGATGKYAGVDWSPAPATGSPLLAGVHAFVDCTVHAVHEAGDHDIVVGRVQALGHADDGGPQLYNRGANRTTS